MDIIQTEKEPITSPESPNSKKRKLDDAENLTENFESQSEISTPKEPKYETPIKNATPVPFHIQNSPIPTLLTFTEKESVTITHTRQTYQNILPRYDMSPNNKPTQEDMLAPPPGRRIQSKGTLPLFSPRPTKIKLLSKPETSIFRIGTPEEWQISPILDPLIAPIKISFSNLDEAIDHIVNKGGEIIWDFTSIMCFLASAVQVFENDKRDLCPLAEWEITSTVVISDLHGDLSSLIKLLRLSNFLTSKKRLVMMGDYVDRGEDGLDVVLLLTCLYCKYPDRVVLLRGNHETREISSVYGFCHELNDKFSKQDQMILIYEMCLVLFSKMKPFCVVEKVLFCHGGIPYFKKDPDLLTDIQEEFNIQNENGKDCHDSDRVEIESVTRTFDFGDDDDDVKESENSLRKTLNEFMWNDPSAEVAMFRKNPRGTGHLYGNDALEIFLEANEIEYLVRGHEFVAGHTFPLRKCLSLWSLMTYSGRSMGQCSIIDGGVIRVFKLVMPIQRE